MNWVEATGMRGGAAARLWRDQAAFAVEYDVDGHTGAIEAAYPASVSLLRVVSPRLALSIILLAIIRRVLCFSLPVGRPSGPEQRCRSPRPAASSQLPC
jgi:hypothetical protein